MKLIGKLAYITLLPLIRLFIRRTLRSYVIVACGGEVLLVKGWLSRQDWHLPGGGVRAHEAAADAALRELQEEVGLDLYGLNITEVCSGRWKTDGLKHRYTVFLCHMEDKRAPSAGWPEIIEAVWQKPAALNESNSAPELRQAIRRAGLL